MASTESEIVELMFKRIDKALPEEKDRKTAKNKARVNLQALTVSSGDRPGVKTLEQVAKYLAENPGRSRNGSRRVINASRSALP
jgi:hypothetical protein